MIQVFYPPPPGKIVLAKGRTGGIELPLRPDARMGGEGRPANRAEKENVG